MACKSRAPWPIDDMSYLAGWHKDATTRCGCSSTGLSVDNDVLIFAVAAVYHLQGQGQLELWVAFCSGLHLCLSLQSMRSQVLLDPTSRRLCPFFMLSCAGCDTVTCFAGRGKKTTLTARTRNLLVLFLPQLVVRAWLARRLGLIYSTFSFSCMTGQALKLMWTRQESNSSPKKVDRLTLFLSRRLHC